MNKALLVTLLIACNLCRAETLRPSDEQLRVITGTIDYAFSDSFQQALGNCESLYSGVPGEPVRQLLKASVLHAEMLDAEDQSHKKEFLARLDSCIASLKDWINENNKDPWGHFFLGSAYGYKAAWHGQNGHWLKSLVDGLKARGKFNRALKLDPSLYDAYTGIGNYHYWSSAKLSKYIPFLPDSRMKGLEELRLAVDSSLISGKPAAAGLAWALIFEKRLSEAIRIGNKLYGETSGGRTSLWILGGASWRMGNLEKAGRYYGELIESLLKAGPQNYYNLIFCRYRRGVCLFGLGKYDLAKVEFSTLLSYDVSESIAARHKDTFKESRKYLERLTKIRSSQ